jgi:hypothetical protein
MESIIILYVFVAHTLFTTRDMPLYGFSQWLARTLTVPDTNINVRSSSPRPVSSHLLLISSHSFPSRRILVPSRLVPCRSPPLGEVDVRP